MSAPSSSTRPLIQPCSDSSCIRLRVRRKVDFPQPDGPMRACTRLPGKLSETSRTATNLPYMAESRSVTMRAAAGASGAASRSGGAARLSSGIQAVTAPDGEPGAEAQEEHDDDEHQCRGPGVPVPFLVGPGGVGEDGQRQC